MAPKLDVAILLGKYFADGSIRCNFPSDRKIVPCHFQRVAIYCEKVNRMDKPTIGNSEEEPTTNKRQLVENGKDGPVRVARQIVPKPFAQHPVLVTETYNGLLRIGANLLLETYYLVTGATSIVYVSSLRLFHIYVCNVSRRAIRLFKNMVITQAAELPTVIHAFCTEP